MSERPVMKSFFDLYDIIFTLSGWTEFCVFLFHLILSHPDELGGEKRTGLLGIWPIRK